MPLRPAAAAVGAVALAVCGAACGAPSGQPPKDYVHAVCTAYAAFEADLTTQGSTFSAAQTAAQTDPVKIKAAAVAFLASQVTASATLQQAVAAQRRPAGDGGEAVRQGFVDATTRAHAIFVAQQRAVAAAAPDPVSFFQVLNAVQQQVTLAGQDLQVGVETVAQKGDQRINDAISADAVCSGL